MTEELNLRELLSSFIKFVSRNIVLLLSFVVISCLLILGYSTLIRSDHYSSEAICTSHITEFEGKTEFQRTAVDLINHLQFFINIKDFNGLGDLLGIEPEVANQFIEIEAVQLYQMDLDEDYTNINKFTINIVVASNKFYSEIEEGLLYYFNNNKFLTEISSVYFESKMAIYKDIVEEISALKAQRNLSKSAGDFINTEVTTSNAVNEIIHLSRAREYTNREMKYKLLSYVQPFSKISIPNNDILVWIGLTAVLSFIFGLFIAFVREVKTK